MMLLLLLFMPSNIPGLDRHFTTIDAPKQPREESQSQLREQVAETMTSVLPAPQASVDRRPKLHLQTSLSPGPISCTPWSDEKSSPRGQNIPLNASIKVPSPTASSALQGHNKSPTSSNVNGAICKKRPHISPFAVDAAYTLPLGTHGILRNSPLPRPSLLVTPVHKHRRIFTPTKRVAFSEVVQEVTPSPSIEASTEESEREPRIAENRGQGIAPPQAEDNCVVRKGRRKRQRDHIWPTPDEMETPRKEQGSRGNQDKSENLTGSPAEGVKASNEAECVGSRI